VCILLETTVDHDAIYFKLYHQPLSDGSRLKHPRISIVVCTMNRPRDIQRCLGSIDRIEYGDYEVIVVDSSAESVAKNVRMIASTYNARYIFESRKGLSIARNRGIRESSGDIVAFTDDDAMPDVSWLEEIATAFADRNVGFVCGKILNVRSSTEASPSIPLEIHENTFWGVNLAFRRDVLEEIGRFDETFQIAGEDQDIVIRALNAGFEGAYLPSARVWHVKPRSESLKKVLKMERRNGKADLFLIVKDGKLLFSNLSRMPLSMVMSALNTLCVLSLLPLIIISILLSMTTLLWLIPLTLIFIYLALRLLLSKAKGSALILGLIAPGLSPVYWFYLFQVLRQIWRFSSDLN
jgi:cellulose synthase/poly-beta-1,6-N-acetylglucosamine synthase-like glycosyltransferase